MAEVTPFRIAIPDETLADLRERLARTRWPEPATVPDWSQGVPVDYLRDLCGHWANGYDWRATEARLNGWPQFRTIIDGLGIHFLHVRSPHEDAQPLVLTHGWPGSVVEFGKVIGPLTDPTRYGGDPADACHLVCPSLPGYAFSDKPTATGWGVDRIARAWATLMGRLGYRRYAASGGDWGTSVSASLGRQYPQRLVGIHLTPPLAPPDPATFDDLTDTERAALAALADATQSGDGYSMQQSTRPQTVGYGLVDSPVALCAWIVEKFWAWCDHDGDLHRVLSRDEVLDNVMLYWLTGSGASSARLYWESFRDVQRLFQTGPDGGVAAANQVPVPTGCSVFPKDNPRPSRRWAARRFTDIRYWHELDRGGHFAAFEQPELFVDEVRACLRALR